MKRRQLIWALALALLPCLSNAADIYVYSSVALKPTRTLKDVKAIVPEEGGLRMSMADGNSEIVAWDHWPISGFMRPRARVSPLCCLLRACRSPVGAMRFGFQPLPPCSG